MSLATKKGSKESGVNKSTKAHSILVSFDIGEVDDSGLISAKQKPIKLARANERGVKFCCLSLPGSTFFSRNHDTKRIQDMARFCPHHKYRGAHVLQPA